MKPKFSPNKNLGQHFLKDHSVINKICDDTINAPNIIEVGPGPGVLTEKLKEMHKNFIVIERDDRFIEHLSEWLSKENVIHQDAMKIDYDSFFKDRFQEEDVWVVSNLPYNISAPLTVKFMQLKAIKHMTLMFQKEVGEKFLAKEDLTKLSNLSALAGAFFKTKVLCKVKPGAFHPPPKVDSIVIQFQRLDKPLLPYEKFSSYESFLRQLFQFKRKQLKANLRGRIKTSDLLSLNIDEKIRAEDLTLDQVLKIYQKQA